MLSMSCFFFCLNIWVMFDRTNPSYQFISTGAFNIKLIQAFTYNFSFGVDGISVFFIILTALLIPLCILMS